MPTFVSAGQGYASRVEHPRPKYWLYIATSDYGQGPFGEARYAFAWQLVDGYNNIVRHGDNRLRTCNGDHTKGLIPAVLHGIQGIERCHVHVISDVKYLCDHLNVGSDKRRLCDYRRTDKKPFADADALRKLDSQLEASAVSISASAPSDEIETAILNDLKSISREIAVREDGLSHLSDYWL